MMIYGLIIRQSKRLLGMVALQMLIYFVNCRYCLFAKCFYLNELSLCLVLLAMQ